MTIINKLTRDIASDTVARKEALIIGTLPNELSVEEALPHMHCEVRDGIETYFLDHRALISFDEPEFSMELDCDGDGKFGNSKMVITQNVRTFK